MRGAALRAEEYLLLERSLGVQGGNAAAVTGTMLTYDGPELIMPSSAISRTDEGTNGASKSNKLMLD